MLGGDQGEILWDKYEFLFKLDLNCELPSLSLQNRHHTTALIPAAYYGSGLDLLDVFDANTNNSIGHDSRDARQNNLDHLSFRSLLFE